MSDHKKLVRAIYDEVFNNGRHDAIENYYAEHVVAHDPAYGPMKGNAQLKTLLDAYRAAMPDLRYEVLSIIGEGDFVAAHWRASGTFSGEFFGQAPTHKAFDVTGLSYLRIADGRVAEVWQHWDQAGYAKQLGIKLDMDVATQEKSGGGATATAEG